MWRPLLFQLFLFLPFHQSFLLLSERKDRLPRNLHVPNLSLKSLFEVRWLLDTYGFKSGHFWTVVSGTFPFSHLTANLLFIVTLGWGHS